MYRLDQQTKDTIFTLFITNEHHIPLLKQLDQVLSHLHARKVAKMLALDYVEHVLWIGLPIFARDQRFEHELNATRKIILGEVPYSTSPSTYHNIARAIYTMQRRKDQAIKCGASPDIQHKCEIDHDLAYTVMVACLVCYENELVKQKILYSHSSKTYETLHNVVIEIAHVVWKHHAGLEANASDPNVRKQAYRWGKEAVQREIQWQLKHLLEMLKITDIQLPF